MKFEYELMRDMLERANMYRNVYTQECQSTYVMLRQAVRVMTRWDRKITLMEIAFQKIRDMEPSESAVNEIQNMARKVLEETSI